MFGRIGREQHMGKRRQRPLDDEHGTRRQGGHGARHTAEEIMFRIAEAAGADDEQVGLVLFGDLRNGFRDAAVSQDGVDRGARFRRGLL